ncbi:MAG: hypothetical protein KDF65_03420 [Anaerolineae bacterium]|nr:hypothetical protein [Anaerolineae bacterium]
MLESIQQAVKPHDKYQFEIKLDYELQEAKKTTYKVSTYIFIPPSLGINENSYAKEDFYRDIQNYIRLKTPPLILREFTEHSASPLNRIQTIINAEGWAYNSAQRERLIGNFKLLSAMLKSSMREHFSLIQKRIDEAPPDSKISRMILNLIDEFLTESENITACYRSFYPTLNLPNVDGPLFAAYKFTDESISLLIDESAIEMFRIVERYFKKSEQHGYLHRLSERRQAEVKHRKAMGYSSILVEGEDNEEYLFRVSALKKYSSSVLYLSTAVQREGTTIEQILFALAAGVSMIFATVVAFYFQYIYGVFTFPLFVALVVGYMFKDRIKETGRSLSAKYLQSILPDHKIIIRTQDGKHKLGVLKEKMRFITEDELPRPVRRARNRDQITDMNNEGQPERIICYSKEIVLFTEAFKRVFVDAPPITGLNDILRYDIRAYLRKMGEPQQQRIALEESTLKTILCQRVYHLNIITRYRAILPAKDKDHKRIRLILTRSGLKRVEQVPV